MTTTEQLSEYAHTLSTQELIARLRSDELTEAAAEATRKELVARGVDVERVLSEPLTVSGAVQSAPASLRHPLRRVMRFPLRAVLGIEPLWSVGLFGGAFVLLIVLLGMATLSWAFRPPPSEMVYRYYAPPIIYTALGIRALVVTWWGLALWRTARRARALTWNIIARVAAALCAIDAILGIVRGTRAAHDIFAQFGAR